MRNLRIEILLFLPIDIIFNAAVQSDELTGLDSVGLTKVVIDLLWNRLLSIDILMKLGDIGLLDLTFILSPNAIFSNNYLVPLLFESIGYDIKTFNGYTPVLIKMIKKGEC